MRIRLTLLVSVAVLVCSSTFAQEPPPPPPNSPPPQVIPPPPQEAPPPQVTPPPAPEPPSILSRAAGSSYERRDSVPYVNLYLPEGQASIRLRKLIKNVLFESQIDYRFITGSISTFLRYKYYARNYTYKLGVFDSLDFQNIGSRSTQEFQRVRGGLFLMEFPRDYNHRYFWLVQDDRLTFGDITRVDNRKNNTYTKVGYQYGTQFDEHLNAIVGEFRGRIVPVLTAFREIGPQKFSLSAALTESARVSTGDYRYTKFEAEGLRRWDLTPTTFIVTRAHIGAIPLRSRVPGSDTLPQIERYTIPAYEMFTLGGTEALRSIKSEDASSGTNEFHVTNEYFVPIFRNRDIRTWVMHWNTLYGIGYLGAGNVGFQMSDVARVHDFAVDAGLGAEASIGIRDFDVLLSVIYAHTVRAPDDLGGSKVRFSIRTIR